MIYDSNVLFYFFSHKKTIVVSELLLLYICNRGTSGMYKMLRMPSKFSGKKKSEKVISGVGVYSVGNVEKHKTSFVYTVSRPLLWMRRNLWIFRAARQGFHDRARASLTLVLMLY